ncbi:HAD-IIA family hydrolase [Streptomyces rhizosphaerihabitans]|uniref:HAD-IIA family hydrolase n=1 Tax=Streptomyces rhizosphaerihabitans TaxID=1266770 RepID=UPI0021C039E3|nr:HAD hydrolase-like protein [Streptomyces rhizosphaerihabitans]MCT9008511.1 HAD hydrolase-like protein [Streptomyces rhizosphaerihabitans]
MAVTSPRSVLLDLDGTLHAKGARIPGSAEAVAELRELGFALRFLTNTDSRPAEDILAALADRGLDVREEELFTPVLAARAYLTGTPDARVYPLVSRALRAGFGTPDGGPYTHVLVGDCRDTLDYPALDGAFRALRTGAELVALQRGRYFKSADGDHIDTGGVVAALEYAAGVSARVLGKPSADFFALAAASLSTDPDGCVVVGDDATTDIAGGRAAGLRTVQVRTGKYADQLAEGSHREADHVVDSVADVPALLRELTAA